MSTATVSTAGSRIRVAAMTVTPARDARMKLMNACRDPASTANVPMRLHPTRAPAAMATRGLIVSPPSVTQVRRFVVISPV